MIENQDHYRANADLVGKLQLELDISTNSQLWRWKVRGKMLARATAQQLIKDNKPFMSTRSIRKVSTLNDRVIIVGRDLWEVFYEAWNDEKLPSTVEGWHSSLGHLIVIAEPEDHWDKLPAHIKEYDTQRFGSEAVAREVRMRDFFNEVAIHETIHDLQDLTLPQWFVECAVIYSAKEA